MARLQKIGLVKSYATEANAIKAVEKAGISDEVRYFIYLDPVTKRFGPVFIGEDAVAAGVIFTGFNIIG